MSTEAELDSAASANAAHHASERHFAGQAILMAIGFLILLVMSGTSVWLVRKSTDDSTWVTHSLDVQNKLVMLQLSVRRSESGHRGYLLTAEPSYLDIYKQSSALIDTRLQDLQVSTADNPQRQEQLKAIAPVVQAAEAEMRQTLDMADKGQLAAAIAVLRSSASVSRNADFTDVTTAFRDAERKLLDDRVGRSQNTNRWLLASTLIGAVLIMILAGIAISLVRRSTRRLVGARQELAEANMHLEEKVAERTADLTEANEEIQRFAYIVSHDLRSPLVNIMGFTGELEAIRDEITEPRPGAPTDEQTEKRRAEIVQDFNEALGFIKSSIGKMDRLIHAILDLSRAGRREFKPEPLELNPIFETLSSALGHQALEAGAAITIARLPNIVSDRIAIEQIFSNLLDNAVKYLRNDRPGRINVTATERGGFVIFRVEDNGRGIEPRDQARVFELFRRAGVQDRQGEGIGLAHVRALVRRLGGSIRLDSVFGEGSTFTVILPRNWTD